MYSYFIFATFDLFLVISGDASWFSALIAVVLVIWRLHFMILANFYGFYRKQTHPIFFCSFTKKGKFTKNWWFRRWEILCVSRETRKKGTCFCARNGFISLSFAACFKTANYILRHKIDHFAKIGQNGRHADDLPQKGVFSLKFIGGSPVVVF